MKRIFMLFLLGFVAVAAQSQSFMRGMLVTEEGDTLQGLIAVLPKVLLYRIPGTDDIDRYRITKVQYLQLNEHQYVVREAEVLNGHFPERVVAFMKIMVEGPVRLLEYTGEDFYGGEHINYIIEDRNGQTIRVARSDFHHRMADFFAANAEISQQIRDKMIGYENLPAIVATFNEWLSEQPAP